jgi:hypothetical protein
MEKNKMTYYAETNHYGNETSVGFANTWLVLAFESKAERDAFVESHENKNLSTAAITRKEAIAKHGKRAIVQAKEII